MALTPRRERAIRVALPKTITFPIEFVKNNPEYSYHDFLNLQARQDKMGIPTQGKRRPCRIAFPPGLAGPRHGAGPMECVTHGSLQEFRTCPSMSGKAIPACPPADHLDLHDRHCHDTCKNLYFFVAFPCSGLTIRSHWEKFARGSLDPRSNLENWESQR